MEVFEQLLQAMYKRERSIEELLCRKKALFVLSAMENNYYAV